MGARGFTIEKDNSKNSSDYDIDKLAYAIAESETNNCKNGTGSKYNNCFGIKNGNTAPCKRISKSGFCIYNNPEESYEAFKKIWSKWYKQFPDYKLADKWTGGDRPTQRLINVEGYYNK